MQALPGSKMSSAVADWAPNPATQIKWGLNYMNSRYDSPCGAWQFWQANNWYWASPALHEVSEPLEFASGRGLCASVPGGSTSSRIRWDDGGGKKTTSNGPPVRSGAGKEVQGAPG